MSRCPLSHSARRRPTAGRRSATLSPLPEGRVDLVLVDAVGLRVVGETRVVQELLLDGFLVGVARQMLLGRAPGRLARRLAKAPGAAVLGELHVVVFIDSE